MQLILESEATVDVKTKMSLSEDNVDKSASDILTGVQNGGISNGDVIKESNEAADEKENNDAEINEQVKEPAPIDTNNILEHNVETTTSKNDDVDTSNDCLTTKSLNGNISSNEDSTENCDPVSKCEKENVERENINVKENYTDSNSNDMEVNCDGPANSASEVVSESEINATVCNNTAIETKNTDTSPDDVVNENSNSCALAIVKQEITDNTESIDNSGSSNNMNSDTNLSDNVNIKQENLETAVCDAINTDICEDRDIKKETEEISSQNNNSEMTSMTQKPLDETALLEKCENDLKLAMVKTETAENKSVSEEKETMETDNTEIDTTDENVDLIRFVDDTEIDTTAKNDDLIRFDDSIDNDDKINDSAQETENKELCATDQGEKENLNTGDVDNDDKINDSAQETENKELCTTDQGEKENLMTGDVASMDVDANISASDSDKHEIDSIKPANTTESDVTNSDTVLPIEKNVSQLDIKNTDDVVVNLDNDEEKNTELDNVENESTITKADDDKPEIDRDDHTEATGNVEKLGTEDNMSVDEIIDLDEPKDPLDSKLSDEKSKDRKDDTSKMASEDPKPEPILKLSNTLDILSDDEEDQAPKNSSTDNKCINIEDDDDIMLIDDDTSGNESKSDPIKEDDIEKQIASKPASPIESVKVTEYSKSVDKVEVGYEKDAPVPDKEVTLSTSVPDISEKAEESKLEAEMKKPLIPENFLKTCKKNLVDMTRDELEEFCILKIVESILDRSNLSEIKNKLKTLTQNLEEYKKKAMMLQKQNRDLQVVFKSVQEDVKKASDAPIVPLKITRSVGMQVLMSDKTDKRKRTGIGMPNTPPVNNKPSRNPVAQSPRPQKPPTQPIPVPRLVPANSPATKSPQQQVNTNKVTSPLPNGVKSVSPVQKGEKRTHNRIQSVTVDLTDDEPPAKLVNRTGPMPPVRLVPSQNLLAAPRTPGVNSPRKVYIPISGPQGQNVRPGQTIMLKTVPSAGPRQRTQPPHMVRMPQSMRMTRPQGLRHPAPLPECMKQYQPPNWKALPPAPDLKLAKVENGIVISWKIEGYQEDSYEEIASYQLYAYQETSSPPNTALWKKIGDVKALPLPMACTLTQFMAGYKYYFAVRAVDIRSRLGPFSLPGSILLLNKM